MASINDPAIKKAYQLYWGPVSEAARNHWTTAEVWDAIRGAAGALGLERPGVNAAAISTLRGMAGRLEAASQRLMAAPRGYAITGDMIGSPPWAAGREVAGLSPQYQVRYLVTQADADGGESLAWRSVAMSDIPETKQDVIDAIDDAIAANEHDSWGEQEFVNLESFQLLAL